MSHQTGPSHATRGIVLMTAAMLSIPIVDGLAKYLSAAYSPLFISWARYAVASAVVLPLGAGLHGPRFLPSERRAPHFWRTVFLITAMTLYFLSIARIPLATAASTFFVGPIIAVVLSMLVLKERMTPRKLVSLGLGVAGSIVMLRPGGSTDPGILLALGAGVSFAAYLIATRQASQTADPLKTLAFQCAVGTVLLTPQALATWALPASSDLIFFAGLGVFSAGSHLLSIAAFRFAEASTLAPLVYLELLGASLIGYFAFGEVPGPSTLAGAAFIVTGGLLLVQRQSRSADDRVGVAEPAGPA